jgi:hypothetical protein
MRRFVSSLSAAALTFGCLPTDTRPPPAEVEMTASGSDTARDGVTTVDGYDVHFERVLASLGGAYVGDEQGEDSGPCSEYSSPQYTRLFDFVAVTKPEKVGLAFALGSCPFGFVVRFPNPDAIIGTGATEADGEFMRIPKSDRYATDAGVSLYVIGSATNGSVTKRFEWEFRERIGYQDCWVPDGDGKRNVLVLETNGSTSVNVEMQPEALFRDQLDPEVGVLRFQPFADADADGDDAITLNELDGILLADLDGYDYPESAGSPIDTNDAPYYCADTNGVQVPVKTLGDFAYCAAAPSVARFQGVGGCRMHAGRRPRD